MKRQAAPSVARRGRPAHLFVDDRLEDPAVGVIALGLEILASRCGTLRIGEPGFEGLERGISCEMRPVKAAVLIAQRSGRR